MKAKALLLVTTIAPHWLTLPYVLFCNWCLLFWNKVFRKRHSIPE